MLLYRCANSIIINYLKLKPNQNNIYKNHWYMNIVRYHIHRSFWCFTKLKWFRVYAHFISHFNVFTNEHLVNNIIISTLFIIDYPQFRWNIPNGYFSIETYWLVFTAILIYREINIIIDPDSLTVTAVDKSEYLTIRWYITIQNRFLIFKYNKVCT